MDAFSVSLADGLSERDMKPGRALTIAGTFAGFQFAMPVIGWILVRTAVEHFNALEKYIPWIALLLLLYIGGKMLIEGIKGAEPEPADAGDLFMQGIATSIDALSVGFTIEAYTTAKALTASAIISVVTLLICMAGLYLGRAAGTKLAGKASILGGIILIAIGIKIWAGAMF